MAQIDRTVIESSLSRKGFAREEGKPHRYFHHVIDGKRTGIYTYTSRGSGYKVYDDQLLGMMKKQLCLDTMAEVRDLLKCPMTKDQYNEKLRVKNRLE